MFYSVTNKDLFNKVSLVPLNTNNLASSRASVCSVKALSSIQKPLLGRGNDLLRSENILLERHGVEVYGQPGVGATSFVKAAASWWTHTKLIKKVVWHDMWKLLEPGATEEQVVKAKGDPLRLSDQMGISTWLPVRDMLC